MTRKLMMLAVLSLAATMGFAQIPIATNANTVAFYALADHEVGTKFVNADQDDGYDLVDVSSPTIYASSFTGSMRTLKGRVYGDSCIEIADKVPGKYLFADAMAKMPMCDNYFSAHLVNKKDKGRANPHMYLDNFGSEMTKNRSQWTLEWFVRNTKTDAGIITYFDMNNNGTHLLLEFPRSGTTGTAVLYYANSAEGYDYNNNHSAVILTGNLTCDEKWHHIALVYHQEPGSTDGTMKLFVDYVEGTGTVHFNRNLDDEIKQEFRFRNGIGDGYVSAIRFSDKALAADEMMRAADSKVPDFASRIAFYPLDDQPVGDILSSNNSGAYDRNETAYPNQVASGYNSNGKKLVLMAKAASGGGGVAFKSVADVPARYIYSSLASTMPMREPKTSLYLTDGTSCNPGTDSGLAGVMFNVTGLSKDLNTVPSWTLEWFIKYETEPVNTLMYAKLYEGSMINLIKKNGTHDTLMVEKSSNASVKYPETGYSICDGKWHHLALVNEGGQLTVFCDYTLSSMPIVIKQDTTKTADEVRFGQSSWRGMVSCIRVTPAALDPREFMYASDSATGVAGAAANWYWKLDGTKNAPVSTVAAETDMVVDADQYVFKDAHAFTGSVEGNGSAIYSGPLGFGHRLIAGIDCGKNLSAVALTDVALRTGQSGLLCTLGMDYTAEAMVSAVAPNSGFATVMGARAFDAGTSWCLKVGPSGALSLDVAMNDGSVVSRTVADGFAGATHHVAVRVGLLLRSVEVFVDYASCCTLSAADFPMPLVYGDELVLGGGCGNANLSGSVDEVRVKHAVIGADDFIHFTGKSGLFIVVQ